MLKRRFTLSLFPTLCLFATAELQAVAPFQTAPFQGTQAAGTQAANQNMVTEFKGKLKGFQRGIVFVVRDDGTEVMVQLPDNISSFQFAATAKPAFLQRGMMVRFSGSFNQAGVPQSPIDRLELFQPTGGKLSGSQKERFTPGVYADRKDRNKPPQPVANYSVVGALSGWDDSGVIMVQAGKRPVRVQLSQDAKLEIRFNNLSLAKEGDPVSVSGFYQPPDETKIKAERITVTTDRVYGEPVETTKRSRRRTRRTENPKEDTDKESSDEPKEEPGAPES